MNYQDVYRILRAQRHFFIDRSHFEVEEKSRSNFVTTIDKMIEENIRKELALCYPHINFIGEEEDHSTLYDKFWLLDPIDGTQNYIKAYYPSMINLALVVNKEVVFGVTYDPYLDIMYHAEKGAGAYQEGKRIHVSNTKLERGLVIVGTSPYNRELSDRTFGISRKIFDVCNDIRRSGSAAYDLIQVALGHAEAYLEMSVSSWDYAPGSLIISEAGGIVTNVEGKKLDKIEIGTTSILASNKVSHQELLDIIKGSL